VKKESYQRVFHTDDEIDKLKSLRIGLQTVDAQNLSTKQINQQFQNPSMPLLSYNVAIKAMPMTYAWR